MVNRKNELWRKLTVEQKQEFKNDISNYGRATADMIEEFINEQARADLYERIPNEVSFLYADDVDNENVNFRPINELTEMKSVYIYYDNNLRVLNNILFKIYNKIDKNSQYIMLKDGRRTFMINPYTLQNLEQKMNNMIVNKTMGADKTGGSDPDEFLTEAKELDDGLSLIRLDFYNHADVERKNINGAFLKYYIRGSKKTIDGVEYCESKMKNNENIKIIAPVEELKKFQITTTFNKENFNDNCFIAAFKIWINKQEPEDFRKLARSKIPLLATKNITNTSISEILKELKVKGRLETPDNILKLGLRKNAERTISMDYFENHYMIKEKINYFVKREVLQDESEARNNKMTKKTTSPLKYLQMVPLQEMNMKDKETNKTINIKEVKSIPDELNFSKYGQKKNNEPVDNEKEYENVLFGDFETYKARIHYDEEKHNLLNKIYGRELSIEEYHNHYQKKFVHKPYQVAFSLDNKIDCISSMNCIPLMLNEVIKSHKGRFDETIMYFHNLSFDIYCFYDCSDITWIQFIKASNNYYQGEFKYGGHKFILRDSLKMINKPLSAFKSLFNIEVSKGVFPYNAITTEYLSSFDEYIPVDDTIEHINEDDIASYLEAIKPFTIKRNINGCRRDFVNLLRYSEYYCIKDVEVLKKGFIKFRETLKSLKIEPYECLTSSSLSLRYFQQNDAMNGCVQLKGLTNIYYSNFVRGGRCMTAFNNKNVHYKCKDDEMITDLDANSLYPTAVYELCKKYGGLPTNLYRITVNKNDGETFNDYVKRLMKKHKYLYIRCHGHSMNKNIAFPSYSIKDEKAGSLEWTADLDDKVIYVNNIDLESLFKREKYVIDNIYEISASNKANDKAGQIIKELYEWRKRIKKTNKPLSEILKLLMNSFYGKQIQKVHMTKNMIKSLKEANKYITNHSDYITRVHVHKNQMFIEVVNDIRKEMNYGLNGLLILSISKKIMNESIDYLQNEGYIERPLYSDTDSIQFVMKKEKFESLMNEELYGGDLGQFKVDYENGDYCIEAYYLWKKVYCCYLSDGSKHMRMKGIKTNLVKYEDYEKLFNGDTMEYDLCSKGVFFEKDDTEIRQCSKFIRRVKI